MQIEIESFGGMHIDSACQEALDAIAGNPDDTARFVFNDTEVIACHGDTIESLRTRWDADRAAASAAYFASPEYKERQRREAEELERKTNAVMVETATTEAEMRETKAPWPYTPKQLNEYIDSLVNGRQHDYGTCVYAMSMAAEAAFNYVAHALGVSGFQASCADLDFIRRTRSMRGPFMLIKAEDALYPQYDLHGKLTEAMESWKPWLKEQAAKNLADRSAHPNVIAHWERLAK